jgi:hypothetical protein
MQVVSWPIEWRLLRKKPVCQVMLIFHSGYMNLIQLLNYPACHMIPYRKGYPECLMITYRIGYPACHRRMIIAV